ncbi:MAG: ABC transporter ATP-binding protein [Spirochaetaceae bacterium]
MALLEIRDLTKHFGGIVAVDHCTFSVEEGTITSLIGPNGAGKTTAFNLITGTVPRDSGSIHFAGRDISSDPPHRITRQGISRTFQITRALPEMTVLENLAVHAHGRGLLRVLGPSVRAEEREKAMSLLEFLGIERFANEKAGTLSYGQRKLLELGAVLMSEPRIVMLDEPAGGVNPALLETIVERILELNKQGITFLIVEHNMELVMSISDPVIVMAAGAVIAEGHPEMVQSNPAVLEAYLGGPGE